MNKQRKSLFGTIGATLAQGALNADGTISPADNYAGAHGKSFNYRNLNARSIDGAGGHTVLSTATDINDKLFGSGDDTQLAEIGAKVHTRMDVNSRGGS